MASTAFSTRVPATLIFFVGKVCYERVPQERKYEVYTYTHTQAPSEIDEAADEKDTWPGRLLSRPLFVRLRIAYPSTPNPFVFGNRRKRFVSIQEEGSCTRVMLVASISVYYPVLRSAFWKRYDMITLILLSSMHTMKARGEDDIGRNGR